MCANRITRIAVLQLKCRDNIQHNFATITTMIKQAQQKGAKMAFLPEGFDFIGTSVEQCYNLSDLINSSIINRFQSLAQESEMWLSLGGFHTKFYADGNISKRLKNTHIIINSQGQIVETYSKINLFDMPGKFQESFAFDSGNSLVSPVDTPAGSVGLQICYDLRFPEFATMLRKQGAEILAYPSAFTYETGKAHWSILLRSRAIENQCYVVAADQTGFLTDTRRAYGHTMVIDPWGEIVAQCEEEEGFIVADIDRDLVTKVRDRLPCFETHRRDNFYPNNFCWNLREIPHNFVLQFGQVSIDANQIFMLSRYSAAFVNIQPVLPGHVLVAPIRQGATRYGQLSFDEVVDLNYTVQKVEEIVVQYFRGTSCSIVMQDGPDAGQSINHVHMHVIPRVVNDMEDNDMLYAKLENKGRWGSQREVRTIEEMSQEAIALRKYFYLE